MILDLKRAESHIDRKPFLSFILQKEHAMSSMSPPMSPIPTILRLQGVDSERNRRWISLFMASYWYPYPSCVGYQANSCTEFQHRKNCQNPTLWFTSPSAGVFQSGNWTHFGVLSARLLSGVMIVWFKNSSLCWYQSGFVLTSSGEVSRMFWHNQLSEPLNTCL